MFVGGKTSEGEEPGIRKAGGTGLVRAFPQHSLNQVGAVLDPVLGAVLGAVPGAVLGAVLGALLGALLGTVLCRHLRWLEYK